MTYDFTLDKKALVSVLAGWVLMALLLFAAGLIVGTYWTSGSSGGAVASSSRTAGSSRSALPTEPVLSDEDTPAEAAAPTKATEAAKSAAASSSGQSAAPAQAANATEDVSQKAVPPVPEFSEKAKQEAAAASPPASTASDGSAASSGTFTVQVGVFLEQNEASRLLKEMERKGYAPSFFADRDSEDRQWYAVRIGAYSDKDQAANAAANLSKQERVKAVVRPLGSL